MALQAMADRSKNLINERILSMPQRFKDVLERDGNMTGY